MKKYRAVFLCLLVVPISAIIFTEATAGTQATIQESVSDLVLQPSEYTIENAPFSGTVQYQTPPAGYAPWPTYGWSESTPEEQGMDRESLIQAFVYAVNKKSRAVVVTRFGYIVGEWYGKGWDQATRQQGYSVTKSMTGALIGMLIEDGYIKGVDQPVARFVSEWRDSTHGAVTIGHLLSMNSGLHWDWLTDLFLMMSHNQNRYAIGLSMDHEPGDVWVYHNAACQVLSEVILQSRGMQAANYAHYRLAGIIGMWTATSESDLAGNTLTYMGAIASAREFAKFGYLYLRRGLWEDEQVLSEEWVTESILPSQELNPCYGYLWWLNTHGQMWSDVPEDAFAAMGMNQRRIYIVPSLDIVTVRLGDANESWDDNAFLGLVCASVIR
jgi:hypothetical protein